MNSHYITGKNSLTDPTTLVTTIRQEKTIASASEIYQTARQKRVDNLGFGILNSYIYNPRITDILVGNGGNVYGDAGNGLEILPVRFTEENQIRSYAMRLAHLAGNRLDDAHPWVDGCIIVDSAIHVRIHAIIPPLSADGTCVSLRILRASQWTLTSLQDTGMINATGLHIIHTAITSHKHIIIIGATGSGKTTILQAILGAVPLNERIISIEDSAELLSLHPQHIRLLAKQANSDGAGEITLSELLKQSLRMRPDRIFVGEVRGKEMLDFLLACNTGHSSGTTLHANSAHEVPHRIRALANLSQQSSQAVKYQLNILEAIIIELHKDAHYQRKITTISVLRNSQVQPIWTSDNQVNNDV